LAFLSKVQPSKTISTAAGSYRLKHIAENFCAQYPTGERIQTNYVSNGAMIAAAIHRGFRYRRHQDGFGDYSINVSFNMAKSLVRKLDKEIRNLDYL
ncbi:MAG: hypothetical protein J0H61_08490, partial [Alphaproteobacteria bacterium]|nr:hypothetical protein [Alphaproteobacteria bacterium]